MRSQKQASAYLFVAYVEQEWRGGANEPLSACTSHSAHAICSMGSACMLICQSWRQSPQTARPNTLICCTNVSMSDITGKIQYTDSAKKKMSASIRYINVNKIPFTFFLLEIKQI